MQKIFSILLLLIVFYTTTHSQTSSTTIDNTAIDIKHYKINLQLDWQKKQGNFNVDIQISFTKPSNEIVLFANELDFKLVKVNDNKSYDYIKKEDRIIIPLHKWFNANDKVTISLQYTTLHSNEIDPNAIGGSFGKGIRFFYPTKTNPIKRQQAYTQSELYNTSYWLPCTKNISDLCTTEISTTLENNLTFLSNGTLTSKQNIGASQNKFTYKTSIPFPIYLMSFVVGEYADIEQKINTTSLHTYCYKDEVEAANATTERFADMFNFLEQKTKYKYPYKNYAQVMVQGYPFPGLTATNTLSIISDNMIDDYGTHKDYLYLWDGVECNALASQWFGNIIIPKNVKDIWLSKAFAQYFEQKFTALKNTNDEYLLWYHPWETGNVFADWDGGNKHEIVTDSIKDDEAFAADNYPKYRGAFVLRILEKEIGEEKLLQAIQLFVKQNALKPTTTKEFVACVEKVTNKKMSWFFNQWVYQTNHPNFNLIYQYNQNSKKLKLTIRQLQTTDSTLRAKQTNYFEGKIEVEIDGTLQTVNLKPQLKNELEISLNNEPKIVTLDPKNVWIKDIKYTRNNKEWIHYFINSQHVITKTLAMNKLIAIAKDSSTTKEDKQQTIEAFQQVISSNSYWRFRFNALSSLTFVEPQPYSSATINILKQIISSQQSWVKAAAIANLGNTKDSAYFDIYKQNINDTSDRVVNAIAFALGKSKSSKAYEALMKIKNRTSWKGQSLMHTMNGLAQLKHENAEDVCLAALQDLNAPRWFLGNAWDFPFVAVQNLALINKTEKAYSVLKAQFDMAIKENNLDDIFQIVNLISTLGNEKGIEIFEPLKKKFINDTNTINAINNFETTLKSKLKK